MVQPLMKDDFDREVLLHSAVGLQHHVAHRTPRLHSMFPQHCLGPAALGVPVVPPAAPAVAVQAEPDLPSAEDVEKRLSDYCSPSVVSVDGGGLLIGAVFPVERAGDHPRCLVGASVDIQFSCAQCMA